MDILMMGDWVQELDMRENGALTPKLVLLFREVRLQSKSRISRAWLDNLYLLFLFSLIVWNE